MSTSNAGVGGVVVSGGSFGITIVIAIFAAALSTVAYVTSKRRANDLGLSSQKTSSLRGRRLAGEQHGAVENSNTTGNDGAHNYGRNAAVSRPRSYYALRAERHVSQYSTTLLEWRDDVMGVRFSFSPILFAVETEERQAPLVFVSLRYLRQPEHSVSVVIETCTTTLTAEAYRDNSLKRIHDCVRLVGCSALRIGAVSYPYAEYCYMDETNKLRHALSVFLTHERFAVTAQYLADTRVKGVLPTAFNELVRSIQFTPPRLSSSYLLCAEPRLGFGFRLPLDFVMVPQLRETLEVPNDLLTATYWGGGSECGNSNCCHSRTVSYNDSQAMLSYDCLLSTPSLHNLQEFNLDGVTEGSCSTPYAAVAGFGSRRMLVVACYEPPARRRVTLQQLFERLFCTTLLRFSVIQNDGEAGSINFAWCAEDQKSLQEKYDKGSTFVVRLQRLVVPINGDGAVDDDTGGTLLLDGAFCVQKVAIDARGHCVAFIRDELQLQQQENKGEEEPCKERFEKHNDNKNSCLDTTVVPAYLGVFCLRTREQCVSISFLSSATQHTLEEFITFCRRTIDTVSVGNHFGQGTSIIYCNKRHEVRPFHILLDPANAEANDFVLLEEPLIGDPLAVFHVGGFEQVRVILRVFPCLSASPTSRQLHRRAMERLERTVRTYLMRLPGRVFLHHWEVTTLGSRAALEVHYTQLHEDDNDGAGGDAGCADLDGAPGRVNPFAHYSDAPPSLLPAFVTRVEAEFARQKTPLERRPSAVGDVLAPSCSAESLLRPASSQESSGGAAATMRVAVVVCCEGCAFMFLGVCSDYSFSAVRRVVRQLAAKVSVLTGAAV